MPDYSAMTQAEFDAILLDIVKKTDESILLDIPGVYEAFSEYFNNDVLAKWEESQ